MKEKSLKKVKDHAVAETKVKDTFEGFPWKVSVGHDRIVPLPTPTCSIAEVAPLGVSWKIL